ncbi:MAG: Phosphoribosyltransferase [Frankiales bacterium]|nr:Phosphoribosyltransferase [Frankiales bacterium]
MRSRGGPYLDRVEAGRVLADQLDGYAGRRDVVVLGLPRGGVPVAAEVAAALRAPLDVLIVRKLGLPSYGELAMGAIAGVGSAVEVVRNNPVLVQRRISPEAFDRVYQRELAELRQREASYRQDRPAAEVRGRVVIVVDDGLATGSTMRAAVAAIDRKKPAQVVVAVPVAARDSCEALRDDVDVMRCPWIPEPFLSVGQAYRDFRPTSDDEVRRLLAAQLF